MPVQTQFETASVRFQDTIPSGYLPSLPYLYSNLLKVNSPRLLLEIASAQLYDASTLVTTLEQSEHPACNAIATTIADIFNATAGYPTPRRDVYELNPNMRVTTINNIILYPISTLTTWIEPGDLNYYSLQSHLPVLPKSTPYISLHSENYSDPKVANRLISDPLLAWINESALVTHDVLYQLAHQISFNPGEHRPTIREIQSLANTTYEPLGQIALSLCALSSAATASLTRNS